MRRKWIPITLIVVGLVLTIGSAAVAVTGFLKALEQASSVRTPVVLTLALETGDWMIYEQVTRTPSAKPGGQNQEHSLNERNITVQGPAGPVTLSCASCGVVGSETLTLGADTYLGVVRFTAPVAGQYTVTVKTPGTSIAVARPVIQTVAQGFAWGGMMVIGMLITGVGAIWLLIAIFARRSPRSSVGGGPAAAWLPDPQQRGRLRWWNGSQWTDFTHPPDS